MPGEAKFLAFKSRVHESEDRLQFLYRTLNMDYIDPNYDPALAPQIRETLSKGDKIQAIKIYCKLIGAGLVKREIEQLEMRSRF